MRLSQTEKYWINSYIVLLSIFIAGFAVAAAPKKVESKYIEMSKGDDNATCLLYTSDAADE